MVCRAILDFHPGFLIEDHAQSRALPRFGSHGVACGRFYGCWCSYRYRPGAVASVVQPARLRQILPTPASSRRGSRPIRQPPRPPPQPRDCTHRPHHSDPAAAARPAARSRATGSLAGTAVEDLVGRTDQRIRVKAEQAGVIADESCTNTGPVNPSSRRARVLRPGATDSFSWREIIPSSIPGGGVPSAAPHRTARHG